MEQEIIEQYSGIIYSLAKRMTRNKETQEELVQEGYLGLCEAYKNFNSDKKVNLTTYAYYRIRGRMLNYFKKQKNIQFEELNDYTNYSLNEDNEIDSIEELIQGCSETVKQIIRFKVYDNLTTQEIADKLGCSKSRVSYILSKEKDNLYRILKRKGE